MNDETTTIRDKILENLLPEVAFDGWTWDAAEQAAVKAGYDKAMAPAVYPDGLAGVLDHFSDWADRRMLEALRDVDPGALRVRDRIRLAVLERLKVLSPWKEAVRRAARWRSLPHRAAGTARLNWRSADRIWVWAGDESIDYNRYTKRTLLAGVIGATMLAWLSDRGDMTSTEAFLDRRIENVMQLGRMLGKLKKPAGV